MVAWKCLRDINSLPYQQNSPFIIYFALENDITLCSIIGMPYLLTIISVVGLLKGQLICLELDEAFMLQLDPLGKGLPTGANFGNYFVTEPNGIPSTPSLLLISQYTATDGTIDPVSKITYSSNIIVTDKQFNGCISRELVYHLRQPKNSTWHVSQVIDSVLAYVLNSTSMHARLVKRKEDVAVGTSNNEILDLIY